MTDLHLYLTTSSDTWLRKSLTFISCTLTQPKCILIKNAWRFCYCLLLISQTEDSPHVQFFSKQAPYFLSHNWCLILHIVQYLKTNFVSSYAIIKSCHLRTLVLYCVMSTSHCLVWQWVICNFGAEKIPNPTFFVIRNFCLSERLPSLNKTFWFDILRQTPHDQY